MVEKIEFTKPATDIHSATHVGNGDLNGKNVGKGRCPFCNNDAAFTQNGSGVESEVHGPMVGLECDGCNSMISARITDGQIFPQPKVESLENVPEEIDKYYQESLRCLNSRCPNAAASMFRKVIEATCDYYDVTDVEIDEDIYDMINDLHEEDYITEHHRKSLLALKDAGNDAVHLNDNDPTMEQAYNLKQLVESVLTSTVVAEYRADFARQDHPNPYADDDGTD